MIQQNEINWLWSFKLIGKYSIFSFMISKPKTISFDLLLPLAAKFSSGIMQVNAMRLHLDDATDDTSIQLSQVSRERNKSEEKCRPSSTSFRFNGLS